MHPLKEKIKKFEKTTCKTCKSRTSDFSCKLYCPDYQAVLSQRAKEKDVTLKQMITQGFLCNQ